MGEVHHRLLNVISWNSEDIIITHKHAKDIGLEVSEIIETEVNNYRTFSVIPSGSKEGWSGQEDHDELLSLLVEFIDINKDEDGGNSIRYAQTTLPSCEEFGKPTIKHN